MKLTPCTLSAENIAQSLQQQAAQTASTTVQSASTAVVSAAGAQAPTLFQPQPVVKEEFLKKYNPDVVRRMAQQPNRCYTGTAPTLAKMVKEQGQETAVSWLVLQISQTLKAWGNQDEIPQQTLKMLAQGILSTYPRLNVAEFGLYLSRLIAGAYGRVVYGKMTPDQITGHLPDFLKQRAKEIEQLNRSSEREERLAERERWRKRAVTHDEANRLYAECLKRCNGDENAAFEMLKRWNPPAEEQDLFAGL